MLYEIIYSLTPFGLVDVLQDFDFMELKDHPASLAHLMYYERYVSAENPELGNQLRIASRKIRSEDVSELPYAISRFSDEEQQLILKYINHIQPVQGCNGECYVFCGVDAQQGVSDKINSDKLENMLQKLGNPTSYRMFYWASDGLALYDNISEFDKFNRLITERNLNLLHITSIPPGKEDLYKDICARGYGNNFTVTITPMNAKRLHEHGIIPFENWKQVEAKANGQTAFYGEQEIFFSEGLVPGSVNIRNTVMNIGINRFQRARIYDRSIYEKYSTSLMTPYGIFNIIGMPVSEKYPQGHMVVAIEEFKDVQPEIGKPICDYLRFGIVENRGSCGDTTRLNLRTTESCYFVEVRQGIVTLVK